MMRGHAVLICLLLAGCATPGDSFTMSPSELGQTASLFQAGDVIDSETRGVDVFYLPNEYAESRCRWESAEHRFARCRVVSRLPGGPWRSRTVRLEFKSLAWYRTD